MPGLHCIVPEQELLLVLDLLAELLHDQRCPEDYLGDPAERREALLVLVSHLPERSQASLACQTLLSLVCGAGDAPGASTGL